MGIYLEVFRMNVASSPACASRASVRADSRLTTARPREERARELCGGPSMHGGHGGCSRPPGVAFVVARSFPRVSSRHLCGAGPRPTLSRACTGPTATPRPLQAEKPRCGSIIMFRSNRPCCTARCGSTTPRCGSTSRNPTIASTNYGFIIYTQVRIAITRSKL